MKRIGLLPVLALALVLASSAQAQRMLGVSAELKLAQDQYLPGEDLQLKVQIVNRSGQILTFGADNDWISVSIQSERNVPVEKTGDMPVKGEFSLFSGQMGSRALNPTPYYDFRQPGRYRISATIRFAKWNQELRLKPVSFTVSDGVPLPNLANLEFGVPLLPGATNNIPEVRKYSLLKVAYLSELKLYFRLTDSSGGILRVFPIGRLTSFSDPEAQIDRYSNLHVLYQNGARSFLYSVLNPNGSWLVRQTYRYTDTRPQLRGSNDGQVFVGGGVRIVSADDLPPSESARQ